MTKVHHELTKEELLEYKQNNLTVGELKKYLVEHDIPDDAMVLVQRVEDVYFEDHYWGVYLKEGEEAYHCRKWNENIKDKRYLKDHPGLKNMMTPFSEEAIREAHEQYHPVRCCVTYVDDKDNNDFLFMDLHI